MGMDERWRFRRQRLRWAVLAAAMLIFLSMRHCFSLNDEGLALLRIREGILRDPFGGLWNWKDNDEEFDHCSWFGVECSEGKVVILNLKDLCLVGELAPEMGRLSHIKSIILRNNSFYGGIPREIGQLLELEVLDLGFNNLSGLFPLDLGKNLSLTTLLLDHNEFITQTPENHVNTDRRSLLSPAPSESWGRSFVSLPLSSFASSSSPLPPSDPPLTPEVSPTKPPAPWWSAPAPSLHLSPAPASAPSLHSPVHVLTPPHSHRAPPRSLAPFPSRCRVRCPEAQAIRARSSL